MKHALMKHQSEALDYSLHNRAFAFFCEQGTGKTVILLAEAEHLWKRDEIDGVLVIAPKGAHTNWTRREIPKHLSCPHKAIAYQANSKRIVRQVETLQVTTDECLVILAINIDAINTKKGYDTAVKFLNSRECMIVMDESSRIKNPTAKRTKRAIKLAEHARYRRIASGTPITNSPPDLFSQFQFLFPDERSPLGDSYRAFKARYCELLPPNVVRHLTRNARFLPQIIATTAEGRPKFKNLSDLRRRVQTYCYRVKKEDCLDLPEKVYTQRSFQMTQQQRRAYDSVKSSFVLPIGEAILTATELTHLIKLQQITSGFVLHESETVYITDENPRLKLLADYVEDLTSPFIVWAKFREELRAIEEVLTAQGIPCVAYHGGVSAAAREAAVDAFQRGEAVAFVGQPRSGGIGLTLTAAETVIYYSNDFNYETRAQSEDRCHRHGTTKHVVYVDFVAEDTIDERIAAVLQHKEQTATQILDTDQVVVQDSSS